MVHADVRHGNVILRVIRHFPDVLGAGRVEYECIIEVTAYPAGRGLYEASVPHHPGVVPIGVL
jgi:hypothetical protein